MKTESFCPYSRGLIIVTGLLSFVLVLGYSGSVWSQLIISWSDTNRYIRDSLLFAGPIVSALGCISGALHKTVAFTASPEKSEWKIILARLIPQLAAAVIGWILGLLPLLTLTLARSTFGMVDLGVVVTTFLTWIIWVLGGYLIGTWIPYPASVIFTFVLGFLWEYVPYALNGTLDLYFPQGFSLLSISPVWFDFSLGIGWNRSISFAFMNAFS